MKFWKRHNTTSATPSTGTQVTLGSRERKLLSETAQIEEESLPGFVRPMLTIIVAAVVSFITWAGLTSIKEVAIAPGEIVPISKVKVVQHLDGGIVTDISVDERTLVNEGQVVVRLDGTQATAELRKMEARKVALQLRAERQSAFAEGRKPELTPLAGEYAELLEDQRDILRTQQAARDSALAVLDRQIAQRLQRLSQQESALRSAEEQLQLTGELIGMREDLAARRLVNRSVLLETRRARVTAEGEVQRLKEEIGVTRQELAEVRSRRVDSLNQIRREAMNEVGSVHAELAEVEETIQHLRARVDRLVVKAPNRGFIQDLRVQTVGQVIQPGAILMQIVPDNALLEAEVKIAPKDVGHVHVGQSVNMRVSSFEYTRFGYATGTLKRISATSLTDPQTSQLYYRSWVSLQGNHVGNTPGRNLLQPGMSLEADIITGEKSLLTYLIKPVADTLLRSFRER